MTLPISLRHRRLLRWGVLGAGALALAAAIFSVWLTGPAPAPLLAWRASDNPQFGAGRRYFEETGFDVSGDFLRFFDDRGGLEIFGYPISAPYNDKGVMVQYFQKARMEWHVVGPHANTMTLGKLGEELNFQTEGLSKPVRSTWRRLYFDETRHTVAYFFLKYFEANGGVDVFGLPITEMYIEDQKIVQYFQCLKLVWDPRTMRVTTGSLGELYVRSYRDTFPPNALRPMDLQFGGSREQALVVIMGLGHATLGTDGTQSIVLIGRNPGAESAAVADASVRISLTSRSGELLEAWSYVGSTDASGRVEASFALDEFAAGDVIIVKAEVGYGTLRAEAESSFVVWW